MHSTITWKDTQNHTFPPISVFLPSQFLNEFAYAQHYRHTYNILNTGSWPI